MWNRIKQNLFWHKTQKEPAPEPDENQVAPSGERAPDTLVNQYLDFSDLPTDDPFGIYKYDSVRAENIANLSPGHALDRQVQQFGIRVGMNGAHQFYKVYFEHYLNSKFSQLKNALFSKLYDIQEEYKEQKQAYDEQLEQAENTRLSNWILLPVLCFLIVFEWAMSYVLVEAIFQEANSPWEDRLYFLGSGVMSAIGISLHFVADHFRKVKAYGARGKRAYIGIKNFYYGLLIFSSSVLVFSVAILRSRIANRTTEPGPYPNTTNAPDSVFSSFIAEWAEWLNVVMYASFLVVIFLFIPILIVRIHKNGRHKQQKETFKLTENRIQELKNEAFLYSSMLGKPLFLARDTSEVKPESDDTESSDAANQGGKEMSKNELTEEVQPTRNTPVVHTSEIEANMQGISKNESSKDNDPTQNLPAVYSIQPLVSRNQSIFEATPLEYQKARYLNLFDAAVAEGYHYRYWNMNVEEVSKLLAYTKFANSAQNGHP